MVSEKQWDTVVEEGFTTGPITSETPLIPSPSRRNHCKPSIPEFQAYCDSGLVISCSAWQIFINGSFKSEVESPVSGNVYSSVERNLDLSFKK